MNKTLIVVAVFSLLAWDSNAAIFSKILGTVQVENSDCYLIKVGVFSDMDTVDPTDDIFLFSYTTVVGRDCDGLFEGNLVSDENQLSNPINSQKEMSVSEITLFPNPSADYIRIQYYSSRDIYNQTPINLSVLIYDHTGQIIDNHQHSVRENEVIETDIRHLVPGNYIVQIKDGTDVLNKLFIKL